MAREAAAMADQFDVALEEVPAAPLLVELLETPLASVVVAADDAGAAAPVLSVLTFALPVSLEVVPVDTEAPEESI